MKYGETMDHVLVRYGEIGMKLREVRRRILRLLNQHLRERLEFLKREVNIDDLVEENIETTKKKVVAERVEP